MIIARAVIVILITAVAARSAAQETPRFTSSVEVTSVDVTVLDADGRPVPNLTPSDFRVRVDGRDRRVVTADWVPLVTDPASGAFVPEGYSSNENMLGGRLFVIAVDQPNIRFGGGRAVAAAAEAFIDRLPPADRVAVVGFGLGAPSTTFTSDRERVKRALSRMTGQKQAIAPQTHHVTLAEAQAVQRGDHFLLNQIQERECAQYKSRLEPGADLPCRTEVEMEVEDLGQSLVTESTTTLRMVRDLLSNLIEVPAPKTLILISEGFVLEDSTLTVEVGSLAAAARTSLYALRLDDAYFETMMNRKLADTVSDREARGAGLETLVSGARGQVVNVSGTGTGFFERLETELSGYYLLGLESDARDRDGKAHGLRIEVPRRKATVRSRREYVRFEPAPAGARSPRDAVINGLRMPLLMSALPVRVASFAMKGPEQDKVQLLIHADIGSDYAAARPVTIGYSVIDKEGKLVDSQATDTRLAPILNGVPSPLQFNMGASVPPGEYTLKLAVADGEKVGSVEHIIRAEVSEVDGLGTSELMVGGPTAVLDLMRPTIGYTAHFGSVQGYVEAYGPRSGGVRVTYEIAATEDGPTLLSAEAPVRRAGEGRALFSKVVPVQQLPTGKYVLRARVSESGNALKTMARTFEVAPPPVLMSSAEGVGAVPVADAELYLPVADDLLSRPFDREDAIGAATLDAFRAHLAPAAKPAFESGVASIVAGDFPKAELSLKQAINPEFDSTAPLSYLAVCFAAAGHDAEASSAWQSALAEGGDIPQIYDWLGGALMRMHDLTGARSIYEEAMDKWPGDDRFTRPLSLIYATSGRGRDAVLTLERYLARHLDDRDALFLGVQWLYHARAAGGVVHSPSQDLKLARTYAAAYEQTGGPQMPLVQQWLDFLSK